MRPNINLEIFHNSNNNCIDWYFGGNYAYHGKGSVNQHKYVFKSDLIMYLLKIAIKYCYCHELPVMLVPFTNRIMSRHPFTKNCSHS